MREWRIWLRSLAAEPDERAAAAKLGITLKQAKKLEDPVGFTKGVLQHSIWGMQARILESVRDNRRTAVKSCHASGKTFISACCALWWVTTHADGIVVTTAPTWTQVEKLLWGEIRSSISNARVSYPKVNTTELKLGEKNYAIGISTNEANRFSGFHSGRVLIILDEAPGVRQEVWEGIQGLRAGGDVRLLAIGNPVDVGGTFHDAFTGNRSQWATHTINAFDTPNLQRTSLEFTDARGEVNKLGSGPNLLELSEEDLDKASRPYLCTRRWVKEMFEEWGPTHPFFQSRVLGEFPSEGDDVLIPLSWMEKLPKETPKEVSGTRPVAGLDVAGPGDAETVLYVRIGQKIVLCKAWPQADPRGAVVAALAPYKEDLERLCVDSIGIGWGMYQHLKDIFGMNVVKPVNVGLPALNTEKFANAKAEQYWGLRMRIQAGELCGLVDEKTIGQLAAIKYEHNARGQIAIENKDDMRKRGMKSPDRAEALMLACTGRVRGEIGQLFPIGSVSRGDATVSSGGDGNGLTRSSPWRMGEN